MTDDPGLPARESMQYDVVIVGAGPAGLSAAMRLKSLDANISVVVVEKGSTVGAHILSGAVIDPIGVDRLVPDWRSDSECPLKTEVAADQFYFLTASGGVKLPNWAMPKLMSNHGNFIGSLGALTRWLGARAEALGVEIYPGFAATELLFGDKGEVLGVATGDMGIGRDGEPKAGFTRGIVARQVRAPRGGRPRLPFEAGHRTELSGYVIQGGAKSPLSPASKGYGNDSRLAARSDYKSSIQRPRIQVAVCRLTNVGNRKTCKDDLSIARRR